MISTFFKACSSKLRTKVIRYLCDFVVKYIKIAVYLESSRKISFNLVSDFFSKWNFSKNGFLTVNYKEVIYLDLWQKSIKSTSSLQKISVITSFTQINYFFCFFWKVLNNSPGFITPVLKIWRIRIKTLATVPHLLVSFELIKNVNKHFNQLFI